MLTQKTFEESHVWVGCLIAPQGRLKAASGLAARVRYPFVHRRLVDAGQDDLPRRRPERDDARQHRDGAARGRAGAEGATTLPRPSIKPEVRRLTVEHLGDDAHRSEACLPRPAPAAIGC